MYRWPRTILIGSLLIAFLTGTALASNITPYYIFDGDSQHGYEILNGVLANTFSTFSIAYPSAIRSTIWLGDRDDRGAREYTLAGTPTGNTSAGGNNFTQLLDGTGDGTHNYGITCCRDSVVTIADADWSNQRTLFATPTDGAGIAYDTTTGHLFGSFYDGRIREYDLAGNLLNSFASPVSILAGLAYEQATDTLWGYQAFPFGSNLNMYQLNKLNGAVIENDIVTGPFSNPLGGEMTLNARVPEPASLGLLGLGVAGLGILRRRGQKS